MSNLMISGPGAEPEGRGQEQAGDDGHDAGADHRGQRRSRAKKRDIPSEQDCLAAIAQAARLAALGLLKPCGASTATTC